MLKITKQPYNSIWIKASSQAELNRSFMRLTEFYESPNPKFRNKIFTVGQIKRWYSIKYGADTYEHDWSGFNLPSTVLKPFLEGLFDPLTKEEKNLLNLLKYRNDVYYIIGAQNESVLRHELSHALYLYKPEYKFTIDNYIKKHNKQLKQIIKYILNKGYCKDVINDELQAYITDNDNQFIINNTPIKIIHDINTIYRKFK